MWVEHDHWIRDDLGNWRPIETVGAIILTDFDDKVQQVKRILEEHPNVADVGIIEPSVIAVEFTNGDQIFIRLEEV